MFSRKLKKLEVGKERPASTFSDFATAVERLSSRHVGAPLGSQESVNGANWRDEREKPFHATLSGTSSPYSWTEVTRVGTAWNAIPGGRSGASNAYEYNAAESLNGKTVVMSGVGDNWYKFAYPQMANGTPPPNVSFPVYLCRESTIRLTTSNLAITDPTGHAIIPTISSPNDVTFSTATIGIYHVTVTVPGYWPKSFTVDIESGSSSTLPPVALAPTSYTMTITWGCVSDPHNGFGGQVGTTVTLSGGYSGSCEITAARQTSCTIGLPDPMGPPPAFGVTVAHPAYIPVTVEYPAAAGGYPIICSDAISLVLDGCHDCCGCPNPITRNVQIETPFGSVVVPYQVGHGAIATTANAHPANVPGGGHGGTDGHTLCGCDQPTSGQAITFTMNWTCASGTANSTGIYTPTLSVSYPGCGDNLPYGGDISTIDPCGSYGHALGGIVWDSGSCSPFRWVGHYDTGLNHVPELEGTYTVTEVPCSYGYGYGLGGGGLMMLVPYLVAYTPPARSAKRRSWNAN